MSPFVSINEVLDVIPVYATTDVGRTRLTKEQFYNVLIKNNTAVYFIPNKEGKFDSVQFPAEWLYCGKKMTIQ